MVLVGPPPPLAWYGSSFAYYDPPTPDELDAAAAKAREERIAAFSPEQFGSRPEGAGSGVVLGRFLPVHEGHRYLLEFARARVAELHVFVRVTEGDPVPWTVRRQWLEELSPGVTVTPIEASPGDEWIERILARVRPDFLFSGETDAIHVADRLGARLVAVDRREIPISGLQIRDNPWAYERFLPPPVRAWYAYRVCLIGPESTGKTAIASGLAAHFGTVHVREKLRSATTSVLGPAELAQAAHDQQVAEDLLARRASRVLFCDTDLLSVRLWSERLFGASPDWVRDQTENKGADLYLLTLPDVPFTGPEALDRPAERRRFAEDCERELVRLGRRFVTIEGRHEERFARAVAAVEALLSS
jgi:HTH-type transcriptional regulator, transcriptional repressor of NAD biosynthesis genes